MLNKKIEDAINAQINAELWSAYLYLSMATQCHELGQPGMANWFEIQFKEEQDHAQIFYNYILAKIDSISIDMEDSSICLIDALTKYNQK